jgi:D-glycero-alpha-D-manno-heptose 1-phosphate guanylyltransferase
MEAIILAGGLGTRLRSVVPDAPKPMAPIAGVPFLEILLCSLKSKGISRAILSIGYKSEIIQAYFANRNLGLEIDFAVESSPLGTGGAIVGAMTRVIGDWALVVNGDTFLDLELDALAAMWPGDRSPVIVARSVAEAERFGRLEAVDGRILRFITDKIKGPGLVNAGSYLLPKVIPSSENFPGAFSFEIDYLAHRPSRSLRVFVTNGMFIDIGVPEDYARAQSALGGFALSCCPRFAVAD